MHFAHANGYPPDAYKLLLDDLSQEFRILAMEMRPLWNNADPMGISDWVPFSTDLAQFLDDHQLTGVVGIGHSMGATTTLRLALKQPDRFKALVLIDPVLFPTWMIVLWDLIFRSGLVYRFHPLARITLRRRRVFENVQEMFEQYRRKNIFRHMSDESLSAYVNALSCPSTNGQVTLRYSPEWEARIYVTGLRADMEIWRNLTTLKPPVLLMRGEHTDTFWESTGHAFKHKLPQAILITIPNATHLLPLEYPQITSRHFCQFLNQLGIF